MSFEITTSFVKQFGANVFHLSQQKGSRLKGFVRNETQVGKARFFDRIGKAASRKRTTRHGDTVYSDTPHSRRMVTLNDYDAADLIDDIDKIRTLNDPTNDYVMAFMWALGRDQDDEVIAAHGGSAYGGEEGTTEIVMPNAQKLAAVSGGAGSRCNVQALRRVKKKLDQAEVDKGIRRYGAMNAEQFDGLLAETEVTSSDFNTVKALVQGEVNDYMGFHFVHTEQILVQSGALSFNQSTGVVGSGAGDADTYDKAIFWAHDGLLISIGKNITAKVDELPTKNYSTQAFASMSVGSTRMEEEKCVELLCKPSE